MYYRTVLEKRGALRNCPNFGKFTYLLHSKRLRVTSKILAACLGGYGIFV